MKRFKIGDFARFVVPTDAFEAEACGIVVEILQFDPLLMNRLTGERNIHRDYLFVDADGFRGGCMDWQLAPIDPKGEPNSLTRHEELEEIV